MFSSESNTFRFNKSEYVSFTRRVVLKRVTYLLLSLTLMQGLNLLFLADPKSAHVYLYAGLTLLHSLGFLLCLFVFQRNRLSLGKWLLHITFISFITSSIFLWQVDLSLQYFYLLALFVSAFMFGEKQLTFFVFFCALYLSLFVLFQHFKALNFDAQNVYSYITMINSVVLALCCFACAWLVRKMTLQDPQQPQNFTQSQSNMIYRVFPDRISGSVISLKDRHEKQTQDLMYKAPMTVVFMDVVKVTDQVSSITDESSLALIKQSYEVFDAQVKKAGCLRIKTDSQQYIFVLELKGKKEEARVCQCINLIRDLHASFMKSTADSPLALRCGVSTGEVSAGVVNLNSPSFDVWGQALVIASRLEKSCQPMHLHCDKRTFELAQERFFFSEPFVWNYRGVGEVLTHQMLLN